MPKKKDNPTEEPTPVEEAQPQPEPTVEEQPEGEQPEAPETPMLPQADFALEAKAGDLVTLFSVISEIIDEPIFQLTNEGILLRGMDASRVAMLVYKANPMAYEVYDLRAEGAFSVNADETLKFLRRFGKDVTVRLETAEAKLRLSSSDKSFDLPTLEPHEADAQTPEPKVNFTTEVALTTKALKDTVADMALVTDHVRITADTDQVAFQAKGDFTKADRPFRKGNENLLKLEGQPAKATYSLSYLDSIVKHAPADIITFSFAKDMPVRFSYADKGEYAFFLAPRIEVE